MKEISRRKMLNKLGCKDAACDTTKIFGEYYIIESDVDNDNQGNEVLKVELFRPEKKGLSTYRGVCGKATAVFTNHQGLYHCDVKVDLSYLKEITSEMLRSIEHLAYFVNVQKINVHTQRSKQKDDHLATIGYTPTDFGYEKTELESQEFDDLIPEMYRNFITNPPAAIIESGS